MNNFQMKIFNTTNKSSSKGENITISPLSIYHILSLTTNGAAGDTKLEMLKTLCNENQVIMNENNKLIYSIIKNLKTVEIANSVFTRIIPFTSFIENAKIYEAKIDKLIDENQINNWCNEATHGTIKKIIEKVNPKDLMILINAIYFKGKWEIEFNERLTEKRIFINYQNEKKLINFMYSKDDYSYFENNEIQAISLKYQEDNLEALIILPKNEYDINKYIENFNQEKYNNIINGLLSQKVELFLPKFDIEFNTDLVGVFQEMGMKLAFEPNSADFSSMVKPEKEANIYIGKIIHSTYIKIDEKGTKAAAVTAVVMTRGRARGHSNPEKTIIMNVNHPFLFIIRNKDLPLGNDIIFISKIENLDRKEGEKESKNNNNINQKERKIRDLSKLESVYISSYRPLKWYMYLIKQILKNRESVEIRARPLEAAKSIRVVEALKKLGYISYSKYYTTTFILNGRLQRYFIVNVKKTKDFQKLYDEREAEMRKVLSNKSQ